MLGTSQWMAPVRPESTKPLHPSGSFFEHQTAAVSLILPAAPCARRNKGCNGWQRRLGRGGEESQLANIVLVTKTQCLLRPSPGFLSTNTKFSAAAARPGHTVLPWSPRPKPGGAEINPLSPRLGPLSQGIAAPLPPPGKKHKSMPDRQPQHDLFTAVRRNLIPVAWGCQESWWRYQSPGEQRNEAGKS